MDFVGVVSFYLVILLLCCFIMMGLLISGKIFFGIINLFILLFCIRLNGILFIFVCINFLCVLLWFRVGMVLFFVEFLFRKRFKLLVSSGGYEVGVIYYVFYVWLFVN